MIPIKPYENSSLSKKNQIKKMFDHISFRYDFLNSFLSLGIDLYWRNKVVKEAKKQAPLTILDLATGTAPLAIALAKHIEGSLVSGVDFSKNMLEIAKKKIYKAHLTHRIKLLEGDSENIPFKDHQFDLLTVAFGIRNFENLELSFYQIHRVLKKDGRLIILEFSRPTSRWIRFLYELYSKYILTNIGKWFSKDKSAYTYLYASAKAFPYGDKMKNIIEKAGFSDVKIISLTFGIASIYLAKKN